MFTSVKGQKTFTSGGNITDEQFFTYKYKDEFRFCTFIVY